VLYATCVEQVIRYAARWDPSFTSRIEPASEQEIRTLASLVPIELPSEYVEFLTTMGRSIGGLEPNADFRIETVIARYRALETTRRRSLHDNMRRWVFIATNDTGWGIYDHYHLDTQTSPHVVFQSETALDPEYDDPAGQVTSPSLLACLTSAVFLELRIPLLAHRRSLLALGDQGSAPSDPSHWSQAVKFAEQHDFAPVDGTSTWNGCFDRGDAAFMVFQPIGCGPYYHMAAADRTTAEDLIAELCSSLYLVRSVPGKTDTLP